jgi:hypothetical protein
MTPESTRFGLIGVVVVVTSFFDIVIDYHTGIKRLRYYICQMMGEKIVAVQEQWLPSSDLLSTIDV